MKTSAKRALLISVLLTLTLTVFAQKNSDFMFTATKHPKPATYDAIDAYASNLTFSTSTSYQQAATKICAKSKTDIEKARAIFAWIGHNIEYDVGLDSSYCYSADGVWQHRKGACDGYAGLYVQLAKAVGLNVQKVSGQTKYDSSDYGSSLGSHSWILVHLADRDMLMDPTWGAGSVSGTASSRYPYGDTFTYDYKDYWFDVDPYIMITTHYTSSKELQVLPVAVTLEQFKVLPGISPAFEKSGIDGKELFNFLLTHTKTWGQYTYKQFGSLWKQGLVVNKTLFTRNLKQNESYTVNYTYPSNIKLSITYDDKTYDLPNGTDYTFKPTKTSNVYLGIKTTTGNGGWHIDYISRYFVQASPSFPWQSKSTTLLAQLKSDLDRATATAGTGSNTGSSGSTSTGSTSTGTTNSGRTTTTTGTNTTTAQATKKQGLNKANLSTVTYTLLDGTKVDNQAHGKPKVLVFFQTICGRCMQTTKNIANAYSTFSDVDLYEIEIRMADAATVQTFKNTYAIPAMKFSSDTTGMNNSSMWQYIRSMMETTSIQLPFIVFIDANNKIQHYVSGQTLTAAKMREYIDDYLIPVNVQSVSTTSSTTNTTTNTTTGQGTSTTTTTNTTTGTTINTSSNGTTTNTTTTTTNTTQQAAKKQGLNKANLSTVTYTLLDGTKVDNQAHGKPKVLIFMQTICPRCMQTSKNVSNAYNKFNDVDLYEIEINKADAATVKSFKNSYAIPEMKFSSDTTGMNNSSMWQYIRSMMSTTSIQLPFVVFIDSNNKIQYQVSGQVLTAGNIRDIIDDYLIPVSAQSTTTTNSTSTNATAGQGTTTTTTTITTRGQGTNTTTTSNTSTGQGTNTTTTNTTSGRGTSTTTTTTNTTSGQGTSTTVTTTNTTTGQTSTTTTTTTTRTTTGQATTTKPTNNDCEDGECETELPASRARKQGLNKANPVTQTFVTVDGKKITTSANGKPKILVFFATSCGRTKNFLKNINPVYKNFADVDVCFIEVRKAKQKAVTTFQKKYAVEEMDFAYDASGNAKKAMETYHKTFLPKVKTVNTPMIVYIDGNNIVQKIEHGKAFTAKEVREVIDNYLVPAK